MNGVEGLGEAVTGGMMARAVEPQHGEGGKHAGACLNCGTPLVGDYCHGCGQQGHIHRSLAAFGHDIAHSVLHFEGKIWHTLPLLAWKPGELTRRYIDGERARFVSPMALFLFSVFMMFAVFSAVGGPFGFDEGPVDRTEAARELKTERAEIATQLQTLDRELARLRAAGRPTRAVEMSIETVRAQVQTMDATARVLASGTQEQVEQAVGGIPEFSREEMIGIETGWPQLNKAIEKANENPSLLFYKIQTNAYKFSWALIPISVPFVWMLFLWRRGYKLYDHTVFVTYSICFMTLGLIVLSLLRPIGFSEAIAGMLMTFVPPIHMYRQLRGAYRLSRFSAGWRTLALLIVAPIAATFFFLLLLALGAFA